MVYLRFKTYVIASYLSSPESLVISGLKLKNLECKYFAKTSRLQQLIPGARTRPRPLPCSLPQTDVLAGHGDDKPRSLPGGPLQPAGRLMRKPILLPDQSLSDPGLLWLARETQRPQKRRVETAFVRLVCGGGCRVRATGSCDGIGDGGRRRQGGGSAVGVRN